MARIRLFLSLLILPLAAQDPTTGPSLTDPNLEIVSVAQGLTTPIALAFLGADDLLVLEKDTGKVKRLRGGVESTVLDLSVNFASERGLLGIALHPRFPLNPGVYLFWSCRSSAPPVNPDFPDEVRCLDGNMTGPDTDNVPQVPLIGNRIDRFVWNGSTLTYDRNLTMLRSFQADGAAVPAGQGDEGQPARANHNGGVLAFGPDGKLYAIFGDQGRRSQLQNLPAGPTDTGLGSPVPDDQFGGPFPDNAHFAGVILRLNEDGSAPQDNPFYRVGAQMGGEAGANLQKTFVYGIRNSFGMAFDPFSGHLWWQENGEDAFDEINRAEPGMNSGWIQVMGPLERVGQYRQIETTSLHNEPFPNLQQLRWGPENIAETPREAASRLFRLNQSDYRDPEFSWKFVLAPAAIGFIGTRELGPQYRGDLLVGISVPEPLGGVLFRFQITGNRRKIGVDDPRLEDRVADNLEPRDLTESESLVFGRNFGVVTDIKNGPDGRVLIVSLSNGAVYRIVRRK